MSPFATILAVIALAATCGSASAQDSFQVSVLVQSQRAPADVPADFPLPPQAQAVASVGHVRRLVYAGSTDSAKRFYDDALPRLGYRLARTRPDGAVWERSSTSAELQFQPVLGGQEEATLIRLTVSEG